MTEDEFQKLSFHDKGIILFTEGKYLLSKFSDSYRIDIHSLYNFYVDVYYSKAINKIKKIELISLDTKKHFYSDIGLLSKDS